MNIHLLRAAFSTTLALFLVGCAGNVAARRTALILQAQTGIYQSQIDDKIKQQRAFYDARQKSIDEELSRGLQTSIDQLREQRAMKTAEEMASDPHQNARMTTLVDHLIESNNAEYALEVELYKRQLDTRHEGEAMIQTLERKRAALEKVKTNLATLTSRKSSGARARDVLAEAEEALKQLKP